jgi:2-dehydropantoate 2-reductase
VIGAGAIGGVLAEAAFDAGHDVTLCVRTPVPGLVIVRDGAPRTVPVRILAGDGLAGGGQETPGGQRGQAGSRPENAPAHWILLATKAHQTASARPWIDRLAGPGTVLVVVQNGVDHTARAASLAPSGPVLPALIYVAARRTTPGRVLHQWGRRVVVPAGEDGAALAGVLAGSGLQVDQEADFQTAAWRKLLSNVAANPITALTTRTVGVLGDPDVRALAEGLLAEAVTAAGAEGARLSAADIAATLDLYDGLSPDVGTSMLEDRQAGRPTEHDLISGAVVRASARHGLDAPLNRAVLALLAASSPPAA